MKRFVALCIIAVTGLGISLKAEPEKPTKVGSTASVVRQTNEINGEDWNSFTYREQSLVAFGFQLALYAMSTYLDANVAGGKFQQSFVALMASLDIAKQTTLMYTTVPLDVPLYLVMFTSANPPILQEDLKGE